MLLIPVQNSRQHSLFVCLFFLLVCLRPAVVHLKCLSIVSLVQHKEGKGKIFTTVTNNPEKHVQKRNVRSGYACHANSCISSILLSLSYRDKKFSVPPNKKFSTKVELIPAHTGTVERQADQTFPYHLFQGLPSLAPNIG